MSPTATQINFASESAVAIHDSLFLFYFVSIFILLYIGYKIGRSIYAR